MNQFSLDSHLHKSHLEEKSCRMFLSWEVSELVYLVPVWLCGDVNLGWWKWPHCPFYLDVLWDHRALLSTVAFIFRWLKPRRCHIIKEISQETDTTYGLFVTLVILSHNGSLVLLPIRGCQPVEEQQTVHAAHMCLLNFAIADAESCSSSCLLLCNLVVNADRKRDALKSHDPRACQHFCEKSLLVTLPMHRGTFSSQADS